jgi:hypothetical protein
MWEELPWSAVLARRRLGMEASVEEAVPRLFFAAPIREIRVIRGSVSEEDFLTADYADYRTRYPRSLSDLC